MINITNILYAASVLIAAILTVFVIPWIRARTSNIDTTELEKWVNIAVHAAEQLYSGSGHGAEKKEYVLNFLHEHGLTADNDALIAMLESAVYEINSTTTEKPFKFNISK